MSVLVARRTSEHARATSSAVVLERRLSGSSSRHSAPGTERSRLSAALHGDTPVPPEPETSVVSAHADMSHERRVLEWRCHGCNEG